MSSEKLIVEPYELIVGDEDATPSSWPQVFWKVSIPRRILSDRAHPFQASDKDIILNECMLCGDCGIPDVMARRIGSVVCWVDNADLESNYHSLQPNEMVVFDAQQYEDAVGKGSVTNLPPPQLDDLPAFLQCLRFPPPAKALYRIPDAMNDPLGRCVAESVPRAIMNDVSAVRLEMQPIEFVTIRIGFDLEDFPESIWEIGKTANGPAVLFREYPRFPVWLGSLELDKLDLSDLISDSSQCSS